MTKGFDLNIEKILENWEVYYAVREVIANALDEQKLTGTQDISIHKEDKGQTVGLWDSKSRIIWIKRSQLRSLSAFAGTLIHECTHAATRYGDVSRNFETALTDNLGKMAAYYLR